MSEDKYADMRDKLSIWQSLIEHPGWKKLQVIAEGQVKVRSSTVMGKPLEKLDETLPQEFMKGEATGIETLMAVPEAQIDTLESQLNELEKDDATEETLDTAGGSESERRELLEPDANPFGC